MELFCVKSVHDTYLIVPPDSGVLYHAKQSESVPHDHLLKVLHRSDMEGDGVFLSADTIGCLVHGSSTPVVSIKSLRIIHLSDGKCAFLDEDTGYFLTAAPPQENSDRNNIGLYAKHVRDWETFTLEKPKSNVEIPSSLRAKAISLTAPKIRSSADPASNGALDAAFEENIEILIGSRGNHPQAYRPIRVPIELDGLARAKEPWSLAKKINFHLLKLITPTKTAAVVTSIKNEGIYIIEWVAHCLAVGFEHVFIYTNGNTDDSFPLLRELAKNKYVTLIENDVAADVSPQIKSFEHSIHLLNDLRAYRWVAYFDCDEFLVPAERYDYMVTELIAEAERQWPARPPSAICIHWDWYGSNGEIFRRPGLVQERFVHRRPHYIVKSIVRLADITTMWPLHFPDPGRALFVNSALRQIDVNEAEIRPTEMSGAKLNHYFQKSFEEYGVKSHRGYGIWGGGNGGRDIPHFFETDATEDMPNVSVSPTPERLLNRVKAMMEELTSPPAVVAAIALCDAKHREISRQFFGDDIEAAYRQSAPLLQT